MKIIPKHQKGGNLDAFFTTYVPIQVPNQASPQQRPSGNSQSSEKGKLTEKDFFDMLKDIDGLPNEMNAIVGNLMNTFRLSALTGVDPGDLATTYLSNLYQVKLASQNKVTYDKSVEQASKNGAMAEPAISIDGKLVVQNSDGRISTVSLDNYFQNKDRYNLLTVSNLANLRAYSPELAYNPEVFNIINNSVGFESFQALIKQAAQTLGSTEYTRNGMFSAEGNASKGLALLQTLREDDRVQAMGSVTAEGLYKYKIIDKNQLGQINALTDYMLAVLPDNAKTWAAFKLGTSNKNEATKELIVSYLTAGVSPSHTFDIDYLGAMDKVAGKSKEGSEKGTSDGTKMTFLTALQNGYGGRSETRTLNFGNNTNFNVTGTAYGASLGTDNKVIVNSTLENLLAQTGIAGITNANSITFGDNLVNSNQLNKIAIENTGGFWAVLPCIKEGNSVTPNFELINQFDKLVQEVINETNDNATPDQKWELLEKKLQNEPELHELLTMTGRIDLSKVSAFYIVDGLASDRNFTFKNSDGSNLSGNSNPLIWSTSNQADIDYFKSVTGEKDFDEDSMWPGDWFGLYDTLYKSKVFIPIQTNNRLAAVIFSGQEIKDANARALEGESQRFQISSKMNIPSSEYLYK